jgi:hypothetical protein
MGMILDLSGRCEYSRAYEDQQKIVDMTTSSTNSFLDAWSTLVEATRSGNTKHVSNLFHVCPTISSKVMVICVILGT